MDSLEKLTLVTYVEVLRRLRTEDKLKGKSAIIAKRVTELTQRHPKLSQIAKLANDLELDDADGKLSGTILDVAKLLIKEMKGDLK
jgi:hypothetical protein